MERHIQKNEYSPIKEKLFKIFMIELKMATKLEVEGKLNEKEIDFNNGLKLTTRELAISLGKDTIRDTQEWLLSGVTDFISTEKLQEWASLTKAPDGAEPNFQKTAKYFFEKRQREEVEKK
jgi:hypothetical protein